MKKAFHHFTLGEFRCTRILDGAHVYPDPDRLLFPDAPEAELAGEMAASGLRPGDWPVWRSPYTCLLIDTGKLRILLDTGAGDALPETGRLAENMRAAGIDPASVDRVLLSHAHPDHTGGAGGFPNARVIMAREEWCFWTGKPSLPRLPDDFRALLTGMVADLLAPLRERIELVDGDTEIAPGVRLVPAPGHTPGHTAVLAASGGKHLVYAGDAVIHEIHLRRPGWCPLVDVLPDEAVRTRTRLLSHAAKTGGAFIGFHLPEIERITATKAGFDRSGGVRPGRKGG